MSDDQPYKALPALIAHIEWVRARLKEHRNACEKHAWYDCQLRDVTVRGQFDPVCLGCQICEVDVVVFKTD